MLIIGQVNRNKMKAKSQKEWFCGFCNHIYRDNTIEEE